MTDQGTTEDAWRAPYLSYTTLANFLDQKIGGGAIPPRIDNGFLDSYAGSVRPLLMATLRTIGMIDESGKVLEPLRLAAKGPDSRKSVLRGWAGQFYREQIDLAAQNATAQMLWETFSRRGFNGSTLRRAVIFYLGLAEDLDLPVSAYFKAPKAPSSSGSAPRKAAGKAGPERDRANADSGRSETPVHIPSAQAAGVEQRVVRLGEAGTVTVIVDVRWLDLPDDQFAKLRKLIKDIEALDLSSDASGEAPDKSPLARD